MRQFGTLGVVLLLLVAGGCDRGATTETPIVTSASADPTPTPTPAPAPTPEVVPTATPDPPPATTAAAEPTFGLSSQSIITLLAHRQEVIARVDVATSCAELHATSLAGAAAVAAVRGDGPVMPELADASADDLLHGGGLLLMLYSSDPSAPYGRWGDAVAATDDALWQLAASDVADDSLLDAMAGDGFASADGEDMLAVDDRYQALGCGPADEAVAIADHLGLPTDGVERDRAAIMALSDVVDRIEARSDEPQALIAVWSARERHDVSLLQRLVHGPSLAGDEEVLRALAGDVRDSLAGVATQADADVALGGLPTALGDVSRAWVGEDGVCALVQLRGLLAIAGSDGSEVTVVSDPGTAPVTTDELLAGVQGPACRQFADGT